MNSYVKDNHEIIKRILKNISKKYLFIGDRVKKINNTIYCEGRIDGLVKVKGIFVDLFKLQREF